MAIPRGLTDLRSATLAWRESGTPGAPRAVFLHGLGGRRSDWDRQLADLADLRRCAAWDVPGYGDSPGLPGSLSDLAATAAAWIESFGDGPVDVVGLSFGGMIAQHLALDHPDSVRTLALLDTSPAFGLDGVTTPESWLASRIDLPLEAEARRARADDIAAALVGPACPVEVIARASASIAAVPAAALTASCRALVEHDTRSRLHEITVPTLVLVGEHDTETPPSYAEAIAERIPGAELVVVPGAGHLVNLEAPDTVDAVLRKLWLGAPA